jgi:hypothetical protein
MTNGTNILPVGNQSLGLMRYDANGAQPDYAAGFGNNPTADPNNPAITGTNLVFPPVSGSSVIESQTVGSVTTTLSAVITDTGNFVVVENYGASTFSFTVNRTGTQITSIGSWVAGSGG